MNDDEQEQPKAAYFTPDNEVPDSRRETLSPSGRYRLVTSCFGTKPGCWSWTQGVAYRAGDDTPIATVQRNYSAFPFLFVESHPNGHDYLVCGEDYQGQTVVELDTGARRDVLSDGAGDGFGFCWSSYEFHAASSLLIVDGCHWAFPYEFRFYDFADPMAGWPEIVSEEYIGTDAKSPEIDADGIIRCYSTRRKESAADLIVDAVKTYRREGLKLVLVEEWLSDYEKNDRAERAEARRKYDAWVVEFKASDPLYLAYIELVKDTALSPDDGMSTGITYDRWCPDFKEREARWCQRILTHEGEVGVMVDLEWAVKTGPIKLVIYRDGKHAEDKFFPHSAEAMHEAFAYAKAVAGR